MKRLVFHFTPLGKADKDVRDFLTDRLTDEQFERYEGALQQYRHIKMVQALLKALFYASIITSIATTFGLEEAQVLQKIASYVGTTVILALYGVTSYITMIRRESYHVQREILISKAASQS